MLNAQTKYLQSIYIIIFDRIIQKQPHIKGFMAYFHMAYR